MLEPSQGLNHLSVELKGEALKPENRRDGLMGSGANTFPPFQSYFRLSPSACFPCRGLVYFLCPCAYKVYQNAFVSESPIHFQRVKQTIHQPVNIPWPASRKSLLEFCSRSTLVSSVRCCLRRVISMTIMLGFSGGSVAPILWGHFQAIKSFICVDLKESCEVPFGWNPPAGQHCLNGLHNCRRSSVLPSRFSEATSTPLLQEF